MHYKQNIVIIWVVFKTFFYKIKLFPKVSHVFHVGKCLKKHQQALRMNNPITKTNHPSKNTYHPPNININTTPTTHTTTAPITPQQTAQNFLATTMFSYRPKKPRIKK
jgi:hypothetical protein